MKIIYLHQYFVAPDMAGGTRSYEMSRRLVARGHEVHIVTTWRDATEKKGWFVENVDGITVHWLPIPYSNKMGYWERISAFFRFAILAGRRAISIGGDVVYATSTPLTIAIPGVRSSRKLRVPMVFEVRDLWPEIPIALGVLRNRIVICVARLLEKYAYSNSRSIVALSPGMADGVAATGFPSSRIFMIPNSSDLELFDPTRTPAHLFRAAHPEIGVGPIILYPGTVGRVNGVSYLVDLAAGLLEQRPDVSFVVLGDGIEWDLVEAKASELGVLNKNFFMIPKAAKRDVVAAFAASSVIISLVIDIPEMRWNSANKFFDALASGTAIAINYGGWQSDLLAESGAGITLPADASSAVELLIEFLSSEVRMDDCGRKARKLAESQFSRELLASRLEDVLLEATSSLNKQSD